MQARTLCEQPLDIQVSQIYGFNQLELVGRLVEIIDIDR
jgi:hypothetical protein